MDKYKVMAILTGTKNIDKQMEILLINLFYTVIMFVSAVFCA